MKKIVSILMLTFSFFILNAQKNIDLSLEYLQTEKNKAIKSNNYELVGKLEKAIVLKGEIKEAVAQENWDKATKLRTKLNDIDFNSSSSSTNNSTGYYSTRGLRNEYERQLLDGGFFIDGMIGTGQISTNTEPAIPNLSLDFQLGTKWHFGQNNVYRPGIQATWFRLGTQKALTNKDFSIHFYPLNVGYASILAFSDDLGMEINLNFGAGFNFTLGNFPYNSEVNLGIHVNPNIKLRYNSLAIGFDVSTLNGPMITSSKPTWNTSNIYSISIGGKF